MTNALKNSPWALAAITSLLYFAGAKAGVYGSTLVEGITVIWPPNAFLLVALILTPYRYWLWILPGVLMAEVLADTPSFTVFQAISFGLVNIFECTLAAWLLKHFSRTNTFTLYSVHSIALFGIGALVIASGLAAILGASVYLITTETHTNFLTFWRIWWFGDALGLLIITPLLLSWLPTWQKADADSSYNESPTFLSQQQTGNQPASYFMELAVLILVTLALSIAIFSQSESLSNNYPLGPILLVPMLIWGTARFGLKGVSLLIFSIALIANYYTVSDLGPFTQPDQISETLQLQEYIAALSLSSITLAALLSEVKHKEFHLNLLDRAIDSLDEGLTITSAENDHKIIYHNPGFEKLTQYSTNEISGQNPRFLQPEHIDQSNTRQQIRQALELNQPTRNLIRNQRKNGSLFWNDMIITPVKNDQGKVSHFIGVQHDITHRIEAAEELQKTKEALEQTNAQLEQKVAERTLELTKANQKLEQLATTDDLTGIANRRSATKFAQNEFNRARRYGTNFSCIMCDIDWFKQVNDQYGHAIGDKTLKTFTHILSQELRPSDLIARFGGEEFLILLPETQREHAAELAERLCKKTSKILIDTTTNSFGFTASFGVASQTADDATPEEMILRADKALYQAKENGRNQVSKTCFSQNNLFFTE